MADHSIETITLVINTSLRGRISWSLIPSDKVLVSGEPYLVTFNKTWDFDPAAEEVFFGSASAGGNTSYIMSYLADMTGGWLRYGVTWGNGEIINGLVNPITSGDPYFTNAPVNDWHGHLGVTLIAGGGVAIPEPRFHVVVVGAGVSVISSNPAENELLTLCALYTASYVLNDDAIVDSAVITGALSISGLTFIVGTTDVTLTITAHMDPVFVHIDCRLDHIASSCLGFENPDNVWFNRGGGVKASGGLTMVLDPNTDGYDLAAGSNLTPGGTADFYAYVFGIARLTKLIQAGYDYVADPYGGPLSPGVEVSTVGGVVVGIKLTFVITADMLFNVEMAGNGFCMTGNPTLPGNPKSAIYIQNEPDGIPTDSGGGRVAPGEEGGGSGGIGPGLGGGDEDGKSDASGGGLIGVGGSMFPAGIDWLYPNDPRGLIIRWRDNGSSRWSKEHRVNLGKQGETNLIREIGPMGEYRSRQYEIVMVDRVPFGLYAIQEDIKSLSSKQDKGGKSE